MGQAGGPQFSPDRSWFWDGAAWQPAVSADGAWRWNGHTWVRTGGLSRTWIVLIAAAVVVLLSGATVFAATWIAINRFQGPLPVSSGSPLPTASVPHTSIPCDQLEHTQVHYHAFLQILNQGDSVLIPTNVGRKVGCYYWLHMHTNESGIIHVESPSDRTFTLGDFFDVWSDWGGKAQLLDGKHVSTLTLASGQKLAAYVDLDDGGGAQAYSGDPRSIVLRNHEIITLEITPPATNPPPAFSWPSGF